MKKNDLQINSKTAKMKCQFHGCGTFTATISNKNINKHLAEPILSTTNQLL